MKRFLLLAAALLMVLVSCKKEKNNPDDNGGGQTTDNIEKIWARSSEGNVWTSSDAIGVYSSDDLNSKFTVNYLEEGKENRAYFEGPLTPNAIVYGAYYPYDKDAGSQFDALRIQIPDEVNYGDAPARFELSSYRKDEDIRFSFASKLATVKLSFENVAESAVKDYTLRSIRIKGQRSMVGLYAANLIQPTQMLSALNGSDELTVSFDGVKLSDDLEIVAAIAAAWKGGDRIEISLNDGDYRTELNIASAVEEGSEVSLVVNAKVFNPNISFEWISPALGTEGTGTSEIRSNYPAVDAAGNVYVQIARGDAKVFKLSGSDGTIVWSADMGWTADINASPSCEPDGSVVYAVGGSSGSGRVIALNGGDGSVKWSFTPEKFFGNGNTPAPNFNQVAPAIGSNCIYVGNAGTTGSVLAINKTNGERVSYVSDKADGTGGPAGGAQSGVSITAGGEVAWVGNYGIFTADQALLDAPKLTHESYGGYVPWAQHFYHGWSYKSSRSGISCSKIDGKDAVWATVMEQTTGGQWNLHVICSKVEAGKQGDYTAKQFTLDKKIENVTNQDQGGIVIGPRGEAIVSLKGTPGSIAAVTPEGEIAYTYSMPGGKDVSGACAVDNNGYIHIVNDLSGGADYYAIVKPDYENKTCEAVATCELNTLLREAGVDMGSCNQIRAWTSVMIGENGKIYLGVTASSSEGGSTKQARVLCLSFRDTTGPSTVSPWPQRAADAAHTGRQK